MAESKLFRINSLEMKELDKKTREINTQLINANMHAMKDTEILHSILKEAIISIRLNKEKKLTIKEEKNDK